MSESLIVVANSTGSRIFTTESDKSSLCEIKTMVNPEGRVHEQNLVSDMPGKHSGKGGGGKHDFHEKVEPRKHEMSVFAKEIADYLEDVRKSNKLRKLLLVAEPTFLGELRSKLSNETNDRVIFESNKNIVNHNLEDIRNHLPKYF